jgi:hypothetical protein
MKLFPQAGEVITEEEIVQSILSKSSDSEIDANEIRNEMALFESVIISHQ